MRRMEKLCTLTLMRPGKSDILKHQLNVAKTEEYIDRLCGGRRVPRRAAPGYKIFDCIGFPVEILYTYPKDSTALFDQCPASPAARK